MSNLADVIEKAAGAFAKEIIDAVKESTLQELLGVGGVAAATTPRRGRPPKAATGRKRGRPPKAAASPKPEKAAKRTYKKKAKKKAKKTAKK